MAGQCKHPRLTEGTKKHRTCDPLHRCGCPEDVLGLEQSCLFELELTRGPVHWLKPGYQCTPNPNTTTVPHALKWGRRRDRMQLTSIRGGLGLRYCPSLACARLQARRVRSAMSNCTCVLQADDVIGYRSRGMRLCIISTRVCLQAI
jgi:hypothetical protein